MSSGQLITIKLMRGDATSWGFRLQGGKDFAMPLSVVKVNPNSLADQAGLQVGDVILKISDNNADIMRHKEAQDAIYRAGNFLELTLQRGGMSTWRPSVTPVGDLKPSSQLIGEPTHLTKTSLAKTQQNTRPIGSGHNTNAKPFNNPNIPALVHKQYNSPVNLYSEKNIAETLEAHTEVLTSGAKGINFMKPDAPINKESAVYQMVHDEEMQRAKAYTGSPTISGGSASVSPDVSAIRSIDASTTRHVEAPIDKPQSERQEKTNQNICAECERLIVGVFVRVKDKSLHAECFRCTTCGTSLKNVGYFNINEKLYCDIHAKQVASLMTPGGDILPVPMSQVNTGIAPSPPSIVLPAPSTGMPQSSGLSSPTIVGPMPYHSTQGVHHVNSPTSSQYSTSKIYSSVPPPVAPKPAYKPSSPNRSTIYGNSTTHTPTDGYRPFTVSGRPKFSWPPPANLSGTHVNESQRKERPKSLYSSFPLCSPSPTPTPSWGPFQTCASILSSTPHNPNTATYASSFTQHSTSQQHYKVPPATPPKPQINAPMWTTGPPLSSGTIPGPGQSLIPGSRPAPRRGRGLLKSQISGSGIPICGTCGSPIRGPFIVALSKTWCPNHFICANAHCKRSLEEIGFVEEQGKLYCEHCYEAYLAPICAKCSQRIKGDCLNALERQWHPECFICSYCKRPFGNSSFYLEDGLPYCEKDWNELFTTKCVGCGFAIEAGDRWVEALNQNYHSNCFKCTVCHKNLEGQSFYAKGGRPFCKSHAR